MGFTEDEEKRKSKQPVGLIAIYGLEEKIKLAKRSSRIQLLHICLGFSSV